MLPTGDKKAELGRWTDLVTVAIEMGGELREMVEVQASSPTVAQSMPPMVVAIQGIVAAHGAITVPDLVAYNDQVHLLRAHLDADPATRDVPVGTVDKFQGRQAAVVLFTMTSSSADDMPRGIEFLSSKNRLNVAVSRAQCLAYLVCTEQLLHSRARTVEDMKLIATLCAFVEYAER